MDSDWTPFIVPSWTVHEATLGHCAAFHYMRGMGWFDNYYVKRYSAYCYALDDQMSSEAMMIE